MEKRIITTDVMEEDLRIEGSLRPQYLKDYIGQEKAKQNLLAHTHNGMVLLLHPTSATNAAILDELLCAWEKEGYRFGTLDELTAKDGTDA